MRKVQVTVALYAVPGLSGGGGEGGVDGDGGSGGGEGGSGGGGDRGGGDGHATATPPEVHALPLKYFQLLLLVGHAALLSSVDASQAELEV